MPAFPGGHDHPNVGMCGGLLAQIPILLQTPRVHFAYVTGGRQLTKVVYGLFFGYCGPLPFPFLGLGLNTQSQGLLFPAGGDDTRRFSSPSHPPPDRHCFTCDVQNTMQPCPSRLPLLPAACVSSLLDCSGEGPAFASPLAAHSQLPCNIICQTQLQQKQISYQQDSAL